jgi:hypothetical protein
MERIYRRPKQTSAAMRAGVSFTPAPLVKSAVCVLQSQYYHSYQGYNLFNPKIFPGFGLSKRQHIETGE